LVTGNRYAKAVVGWLQSTGTGRCISPCCPARWRRTAISLGVT